nr:MAG TPA: hypothetical protein [Caudoviricetes sp.]
MEMKLNALQINLQRFIRNVRFVFVVSRWWKLVNSNGTALNVGHTSKRKMFPEVSIRMII